MYANIFSDVHVDDIRMKKRLVAEHSEMITEDVVREVQLMGQPLPERDRPLPSRYDDDRRDRYDDRRFEQMQYADLYRFGY